MEEQEEKGRLTKFIENRWYISVSRVLFPFWVGFLLVSVFGIPDWPYVRDVPRSAYQFIFILMLAFYSLGVLAGLKVYQQDNLEKYDPESPGVITLRRRLQKTGWTFSFLTIFFTSLTILLAETDSEILDYNLFVSVFVGITILCISIAVFAFHLASDIKTGMIAPPKWLIPSDDQENWR